MPNDDRKENRLGKFEKLEDLRDLWQAISSTQSVGHASVPDTAVYMHQVKNRAQKEASRNLYSDLTLPRQPRCDTFVFCKSISSP